MNQKLVFSKKKKIYIASFGPCVNVLYVDVHHTIRNCGPLRFLYNFVVVVDRIFFRTVLNSSDESFREKRYSKGHPTFNHTISLISAAERRPKNTHMHKSEILLHICHFFLQKNKLSEFYQNFTFFLHARRFIEGVFNLITCRKLQ